MTPPPTITAHDLETSRAAALQIAVLALEASALAKEMDPISSYQFQSILEQARRIKARCDTLATAMRGTEL
jgi:hypothetical protein